MAQRTRFSSMHLNNKFQNYLQFPLYKKMILILLWKTTEIPIAKFNNPPTCCQKAFAEWMHAGWLTASVATESSPTCVSPIKYAKGFREGEAQTVLCLSVRLFHYFNTVGRRTCIYLYFYYRAPSTSAIWCRNVQL